MAQRASRCELLGIGAEAGGTADLPDDSFHLHTFLLPTPDNLLSMRPPERQGFKSQYRNTTKMYTRNLCKKMHPLQIHSEVFSMTLKAFFLLLKLQTRKLGLYVRSYGKKSVRTDGPQS